MDDNYKVVEYTESENPFEEAQAVSVFYGDLANCEAYIRLHQEGYM